MAILDLSNAPADAASRLVWLSGVKQAAQTELEDAYAETYATLRREGRFEWAVSVGIHGKTKALALTRKWNNSNGRLIRWGDRLDPTSTQFHQ